MDFFFQLSSLFLRLGVATLVLWVAARRTLAAQLVAPELSGDKLLLLCGALSAFGIWLYNFIKEAPRRRLPTYTIFDFRELLPITSAPRGQRALQWVRQNPGADLINLRIIPGFSTLIPVSARAHRDLLNNNAQDFEKPDFGRRYLSGILGSGLVLAQGSAHRRQRKAITPSFKIQNIRSLQPLMADKTDLMLEQIGKEMQQRGQIEIASWGSRVTMDIIGPAFMSKDFQSLTTPNSPMEDAYHQIIAPSRGQSVLFALSMLLPQFIVRAIPIPTNRMLRRNIRRIQDACRTILAEKMNALKGTTKLDAEEATADILGSIMSGGEFNEKELMDEMMTFLSAGHETTAASIAWATHLLTLPQYSHYQAELRDEVRAAMAARPGDYDTAQGILSYQALESLPLLHGICEETLRLFPPVTNTGRVAIRDTFVADTPVRKGSMLAIFPWAINRNPEFWGTNADEMVPARWCDTDASGTKRVNKHGGAPSNFCEETFLHGNRACVGRDFAKAELRYIIAALFEKCQVKRLPGDHGHVVPAGALTIKPAGGLHVSVVPWSA